MLKWLRSKVEAPENPTSLVVHRYDRVVLGVTLALMAVGVVMVYSASIVSAELRNGDSGYYLGRQLAYCGLGLVALVAGLNLHHDILRRLAIPVLVAALVLLVVVLLPGISASAKGAARWINLGPARFQPSEAMKLAWIVFLAAFLSRRQEELADWRAAWRVPMLMLAAISGLLMLQPDFGSTLICGGLMVLMVWAAGGRWLHVGGLGLLGVGLVFAAVYKAEYRVRRLVAFWNPEADPQGAAYHINQALISFGSGEWTGLGLGGSRQKLLYLPEAHTDFVFSIIGEELGFIGAAVIIALFAVFVWRGFRIARNASSAFGALLAFGITAEIGFQAATNMAVAVALLPTKGLTLPFVSYGGSSLVTVCAAVGVLLNISRRQPPPSWLHAWVPEPAPRPRTAP